MGDANEYLFSDMVTLEDVNFISDVRPAKCQAKFRYRQKDVPVEIVYDSVISVKYNHVKAVTPGQLCVLYLDDECIGSGIIKDVYKDNKKIWYL